jgi:protease-4
VFGIFPTFDKAMQSLSINTEGYGTTWLRGAYDPRRPLDPKFQQMLQGVLGQVYEEFITKTAEARKLDPKKVDAVGGGRVWLGQQALDHGLIDKIGGLDVAIGLAAEKAKLGADTQTRYFKKKDSGLDQFIGKFLGTVAAEFGIGSRTDLVSAMAGASAPIMSHFERDLQWLANITSNAQAKGLIQPTAHCFCSPLDF